MFLLHRRPRTLIDLQFREVLNDFGLAPAFVFFLCQNIIPIGAALLFFGSEIIT